MTSDHVQFKGLGEIAMRGVLSVGFDCGGHWNWGSAWLVKTDKDDGIVRVLLTARHVLEYDSIGLRLDKFGVIDWPRSPSPSSPTQVPLTRQADSVKHDLALVTFIDDPTFESLHRWELADADATVQHNDAVRYITTRRLKGKATMPWLSDGVVAFAADESIHTNTAGIGGESGGVLINADMKAIGLIRSTGPRLERKDLPDSPAGTSMNSTHFKAIREFLIEAGYLNE